MKIYVASSWRNEVLSRGGRCVAEAGHDVYDLRNPPSGDDGFKWSNVDPNYKDWSPEEYRQQLSCPQAERQFKNDIKAMLSCNACVLVLPCGRSAHTEAGWFAGKGKRVIVYIFIKQPKLKSIVEDTTKVNIADFS